MIGKYVDIVGLIHNVLVKVFVSLFLSLSFCLSLFVSLFSLVSRGRGKLHNNLALPGHPFSCAYLKQLK